MAYSISVGDFIESQFVYLFNGQTFRNVFHFKVTGGPAQPNGDSFLHSVSEYLEAGLWTQLRLLLSNQLELQFITSQKVQPLRYRIARTIPTDPLGDIATAATPPTSCVVVRRYAQRSGRKYQGRVYLPGLPQDAQSKGIITDTVQGDFLDMIDQFNPAPTISGTQLEQYLNVGGVDVNLQAVIGVELDPVLRSQRRREIGKGE